MTRRLLALMMAVVVAAAPEAIEVCHVICATVTRGGSTTPASGLAHHHSHHQEAVPSGRPALQAVSNACGPGRCVAAVGHAPVGARHVRPAIAADRPGYFDRRSIDTARTLRIFVRNRLVWFFSPQLCASRLISPFTTEENLHVVVSAFSRTDRCRRHGRLQAAIFPASQLKAES